MKKIIYEANKRGYFNHGWLKSYHTFSFADYYDPNRMGFGALRVVNDDVVSAGYGFDMHPHKNMEVISIPLSGFLTHTDSTGKSQTITNGQIQIMSAGKGIYHSEFNNTPNTELHFLQIWIFPRSFNTPPSYQDYQLQNLTEKNKIHFFISPNKDFAHHPAINQEAWFSYIYPEAGTDISYKLHDQQNGVFIFLLDGEIGIAGEHLFEKDAIGIWDTEEININATQNARLLCIEVPMEHYTKQLE